MLVDLKPEWIEDVEKQWNDTNDILLKEGCKPVTPWVPPKRIAEGIYEYPAAWIFDQYFVNQIGCFEYFWNKDIVDERFAALKTYTAEGWPPDYGIADSVEQILERYPVITTCDKKVVMFVTFWSQEDESGWRWHKQGEYIGIHHPKHEYFRDDTEIEKVVWWEFKEINE